MSNQIVIIYPMPLDQINDLKNCKDYNTMQAYHIHRYAKDRSKSVGTPIQWMFKRSDSKYHDLLGYLKKEGLQIENINDLVLTGVNATKWFSDNDLEQITKKIKGNLYKIDDSNYFQDQWSFTFAHFIRNKRPSDKSFNLSLAVGTDLFVPLQDLSMKEFIVHVDHRWTQTDRLDSFLEIKSTIKKIIEYNQKFKRWQNIKIIYHTDEIKDLDQLGQYNPKSVSITELAKIYGSAHLSFVSHAETLGQYPLEMLSCGVTIISHRKMIPKEIRNLYPFINIEKFDIEKFFDTYSEKVVIENRKSVIKFDYENWVNRMFNILQKEKKKANELHVL